MGRRVVRWATAIVMAGAAIGPAAPALTSDDVRAAENGRLVFVRIVDYARDSQTIASIYVVNENAAGLRRLTRPAFGDYEPAWSPDGRRIAFVRFTGAFDAVWNHDPREIYVMNSDGSNVRRLTRNRLYDGAPSWSRDGRRILFSRGRVVVDRLTRVHADLWVMQVDGQRKRRLTRSRAVELDAAFSPDGRRIAFLVGIVRTSVSTLAPGFEFLTQERDVWTMRADGRERRRTALGGMEVSAPSWSPDGRRLVVSRHGVVTIGSVSQKHVTELGSRDDYEPDWSPDGSRVAFSRGAPETSALLHVLDLRTRRIRSIDARTPAQAGRLVHDTQPDWRPVPRRR